MTMTSIPSTESAAVSVETITPDIAEVWLKQNTHNREIRDQKVDKWAHAMSAGQWRLNGQTICFDPNGILVDGQHRLAAVVKSGVTIQSVVVRGINMETQITVDTHTPRSFGDVLKWRGESAPVGLAAAVRALYRFKFGDGWATQGNSDRTATYDDLLDVLKMYPGIRQSRIVAEHLRKQIPVPTAQMAALHYMLWETAPLEANTFFDLLTSGESLKSNDPIYMLRRCFLNDARSTTKLNVRHRLALTIKAWNAWITGAEMKLLVWRPGGANPEQFPTVVDLDGVTQPSE